MKERDSEREKCEQRQKRFLSFCLIIAVLFLISCKPSILTNNTKPQSTTPQNIPRADGFDYPISKNRTVTEAKDKDDWYNAQDFTVNNHLGEDWNKNTGGDTDCGEPVYAAANGLIVYAQDAGTGWGNVVIIEHVLKDGTRVQTLYGHLQSIAKTSGEVKRREQIGNVGNANGRYLCHLHFEVRFADCPAWNSTGQGYSEDRKGWTDPSKFIDANRPAR